MVKTVLGVSSRACLGLRTAPANAWGLAVSCISGTEWTEERIDWMLLVRWMSCMDCCGCGFAEDASFGIETRCLLILK